MDQGIAGAPAGAESGRSGRSWTTIVDGQRLRQLRREHGLSQAELAGKAGVSLSTLARLEGRARTSCRCRTLARLATALGEGPASTTLHPSPDKPGPSDR